MEQTIQANTMEFYLVTIQAPSFTNVARAVIQALRNSKTDIVFKFKVVGEPVIIFIISNLGTDFDNKMDEVMAKTQAKVSCQPLMAYEEWAKIIGVDPALTGAAPRKLTAKTIYWGNLRVEYTGMTVKAYQDCCKDEAEAILTARSGGLEFEAFKVPLERRFHVFLGIGGVDIEKTAQNLPLFVNIGDRVHVEMKALRPLNELGQL